MDFFKEQKTGDNFSYDWKKIQLETQNASSVEGVGFKLGKLEFVRNIDRCWAWNWLLCWE